MELFAGFSSTRRTAQHPKMSSQTSLIAAFFGDDSNLTPLSPARRITEVPAPMVTYDGITYTFIIFRKNGTWLKDFFDEHILSFGACREDELFTLNLSPFERGQVKMAADGLIYYIKAAPRDGRTSFIWLESKEEADAVAKAVKEAEVAQMSAL